VSGEAILSAENTCIGKPLGRRGSAPNPAGEADSAAPDPVAGEEGACCPLSGNSPHPTRPTLGLRKFGLDFRPFSLAPPINNSGHSLG